MKKYLFLTAILVLGLVGVVQAQAEDGDRNKPERPLMQILGQGGMTEELKADRAEVLEQMRVAREEAKAKFEALRERIKEERDAAKAKIKELRLEVRGKFLERFDGAVARMEALEERVNAAIVRLGEKGIDTEDAEAFMVTADEKLEEAKEKITELNELLAKSIDQLTAEDKTSLRTLAQETQALLRETHEAIKSAVKSLREEVQEAMGNQSDDEEDEDENDEEENENESEND